MATPLLIHLSVFLLAAVLLYAGTQVLFQAFAPAVRPLLRGAVLALPVVGCGLGLAITGHGPRGIALAASAAAVMLTLGGGVVALGAGRQGAASATLRMLLPLTAGVTLIGFSGQLTVTHGVLVAAMAAVLVWARPDETRDVGGEGAKPRSGSVAIAVGLLVLGSVATLMSVLRLGSTVPISVTTPAVVLMLVVAALGLLATESQATGGAPALDTVVGYVTTALGLALPITILASVGHAYVAESVVAPTTQATTAPVLSPAVLLMPVPTWRIDTLVLLVTSLYLIPASYGRARLGRVDGYFLVTVGVAFVIATVGTLGRLID
jgi:hypothetical protein